MRQITRHLMPRYVWFLMWFKKWFIHPEGIKGFASQTMNQLMQRTLALAKKLKNKNRKLNEEIKALNGQLVKWYKHATVDADEWDSIRNTVRKLKFWIVVGTIAETACNYFAVQSVMEGKGWFWIALRIFVALAATGISFYFFEQWFAMAINKPAYKQLVAKKRNWTEFVLVTLVCIAFESFFYWLCIRRSNALEGATGDDAVRYVILLLGMLLPVAVGYYAYKRSRYINAYKNTLRITNAERKIAKKERKIAANNQHMEDHFKKELEATWCITDEFRIYKGVYNAKHNIEHESLQNHFCETHESFAREAIDRYNKQMIQADTIKPAFILGKEQQNGQVKALLENSI